MNPVESFLSSEEEFEIIATIRQVESQTSGEIRVHIEKSSNQSVDDRAKDIFHALKMDNTIQKNGVLIYISVENKTFGIYGDKGIDNCVATTFWNDTRDAIQYHFKKGEFAKGIIQGIETAGEALKHHFPWKQKDQNELSDEISKSQI